jgi:hypothetical protein
MTYVFLAGSYLFVFGLRQSDFGKMTVDLLRDQVRLTAILQ